ncbi:MAG: hypothetical protein MUQ00_04780 [Candidatus Aminicenantes bacterium]|nr:hypothetical protein [Candidatus Aminicenantes bacterium]
MLSRPFSKMLIPIAAGLVLLASLLAAQSNVDKLAGQLDALAAIKVYF